MSEGKVLFIYNGKQTIIQCNANEKLNIICERFINELQLDKSKIYHYIYNGNIINKDLTFEEQANNEDKTECKMNIIVVDEMNKIKNENIKESEEIICPECKENILIKIDEYKINMYNCKNNHKINNITIKEFDNTQKIDISKIVCDICKVNNKSNIYNNEIYKCITCCMNICPLCKSKHDNNHIIVKYEDRNIICNKHNDKFVKYCNECNEDICMKCTIDHNNHKCINYTDIIGDIDINKEYKEHIDILINNINEIINKLEEIKENMLIYYNKSDKIINNRNNINYKKLENIKEFNNYNNKIIKDIKLIINDNDINNKFKNIIDIYNKINNNNIIIGEIDIKNDDINKDIRIINSFEEYKREWKIKDKEDDYKYENEKEIKENCKIKINNEIIPFNYFYKFNKIGKYKIEYSFHSNLTKTNHMFCLCKSLTNIDLSNFNSQNVTNMCGMFCGCGSLTNINLSNFNTQNVTNMSAIFGGCKSLTNINLSNFNTQNVTNMSCLFLKCGSLTNIDLSNFNTQNATNMNSMFYECKSLTNIDLSNFNTQNVTDMSAMFCGCGSLQKQNVITNDNKILDTIK